MQKEKRKGNKKGQIIPTIIFFVFLLFAITIAIFVNRVFVVEVDNAVKNDADFDNEVSQSALEQMKQTSLNWDTTIVFLFVGLGIIIFAAVSVIKSTPILAVPAAILLFIFMLMVPQLSNTIDDIEQGTDSLAEASQNFEITNGLWDIAPKFFTAIAVGAFIFLWAKKRSSGGFLG